LEPELSLSYEKRREAVAGWIKDKRGNATFLTKGSVDVDNKGLVGKGGCIRLERERSKLRHVTFAEDVRR
jgi:hypothetical protein